MPQTRACGPRLPPTARSFLRLCWISKPIPKKTECHLKHSCREEKKKVPNCLPKGTKKAAKNSTTWTNSTAWTTKNIPKQGPNAAASASRRRMGLALLLLTPGSCLFGARNLLKMNQKTMQKSSLRKEWKATWKFLKKPSKIGVRNRSRSEFSEVS